MKVSRLLALCLLTLGSAAMAQGGYNKVPLGDAQYAQCLRFALKLYEGGNEASPVKGQTKVEAWCTCLWNETPDDFKGNLVKFAESSKGKVVDKVCAKHADWSD